MALHSSIIPSYYYNDQFAAMSDELLQLNLDIAHYNNAPWWTNEEMMKRGMQPTEWTDTHNKQVAANEETKLKLTQATNTARSAAYGGYGSTKRTPRSAMSDGIFSTAPTLNTPTLLGGG